MRFTLTFLLLFILFSTASITAQKTLVIYDPTIELMDEVPALPDDEAAIYEASVLRKLKAKYESEGCSVDPELLGEVSGSFTKKGVVQKAAFYQVCTTGNGLGIIAVIIFEDAKLVGIWGENSGWGTKINTIADLNLNGIDELTLSFGGGLHQGQGGVGVEIIEFRSGKPQVLGWFQAERTMDTQTESAWKVSVKTGKAPTFYRQKYKANSRGKLIKTGVNSIFKLTTVENNFELIN